MTVLEPLKHPERFQQKPDFTKEDIKKSIDYILKKIDENLENFTFKYPAPASQNLIYPAIDNTDWTSSFWTGMLWLAYEYSGDEKYKKIALIQVEDFKRRIETRSHIDTHDLGFLYTLSCMAGYRILEDPSIKAIAIDAAKVLMERYYEKAGIIQAWGDLSDVSQQGRMIIDCCMNLPLLYFASEESGDSKFNQAAYSHIRQAIRYLVRDDASSYHTFYMDVHTGEPLYGKTCQGYSDDSCWARGQAWGMYGLPLSYSYTKDASLLDMNKRISHYFLNRLPEDHVCYWDLIFTEGYEERDSSSVPIAACGLLEYIKYLDPKDPDRALYENAAIAMIQSLSKSYTSINHPESNGILLHAVYSKPDNKGVNECNIWGDYFYFEALMRLDRNWKMYW